MNYSMPSFPAPPYLWEFAQIHIYWVGVTKSQTRLSNWTELNWTESVVVSNHLILCRHTSHAFVPSSIRVFSNEFALHIKWLKYWNFSFSISPSKEYAELISFRIEWLYLLAVQGTLKSLLQDHNSKASILWCSAFFMAQFSHPYMTTGKTVALTIQTFVSKLMSLLFNILSRLVIAFLPRSKHLFISWLQSPFTVILEPRKRKSVTTSTFSPSVCHEVRDTCSLEGKLWPT